jgi:hypothetical protein
MLSSRFTSAIYSLAKNRLGRTTLSFVAARLKRDKDHISREHVIWAYRLFLDRDPESETAILGKSNT